jgi:integrase
MGEIARERGSRAAQLAFELLVAALRAARRLGLLGVDVTTDCRRPPHRPRPRRWLTAHELQRLVTSLRHSADPDAPLVLLLVATALRVGELIALRWGDVDLTTGWLYVRRTRLRLNGVWLEQEPKTRAGMRAVPLTALAREALGRLPRGLAPEAFIFDARGPHGGRLLNSDYVERAVRRLCRVADVPPQTPHALRHAAVSAALAHGAPLAEIARVVGHTTPHVTARVYAHALGQPARVAQALNQALEG